MTLLLQYTIKVNKAFPMFTLLENQKQFFSLSLMKVINLARGNMETIANMV